MAVFHLLFPFLDFEIAPDLACLAEVCKETTKECRKMYCKHCGKVFSPFNRQFDYQVVNGRASHVEICEWMSNMDPFRFFYLEIDWVNAFVAGGWASWLHFREHRNYINPWRKNGPMSKRDLDVFFYYKKNNSNIMNYYFHWTHRDYRDYDDNNEIIVAPSIEVVQFLQKPSTFHSDLQKYNTTEECSTRLLLRHKAKLCNHFLVDLIGEKVHYGDQLRILSDFDQPCCRVGFSFVDRYGTKSWILHPTHKNKLQKPSSGSTPREKERYAKYVERGYAHLECDCHEIKFRQTKRQCSIGNTTQSK